MVMVGTGHHVHVVHVRHHADNALRRGVYHGNEFQDRVVPHQMMVQRIAIGEHPPRGALADNRDWLATLAVGIVEIASFDDRQAQRGEKSG